MAKNYLGQLEALFFVAGDKGLTLTELSQLLVLAPSACLQQVEKFADLLTQDASRGLQLLNVAQTYKLVTKSQYQELLESYAKGPHAQRLSKASLETLAIISYRQPLSRNEIDEIRGVQSSGALQTLVLKKLVTEVGRLETPGRPILYGTTPYFLDYFGLKDISELPDITQLTEENTAIPDLFFNEEEPTENEED